MEEIKKNNYKFEIITDTSTIEVLADSYELALKKIQDELKVPPKFISNCYLERITIVNFPFVFQEQAK